MRHPTARRGAGTLRALVVLAGVLALDHTQLAQAQSITPTQSSPVAISADDFFLVNVNPEANTISVFDLYSAATPTKLAEIAVGREPNSVAFHPFTNVMYVANTLDGTISVVDLYTFSVISTCSVGVEPMAVCLSPNGTMLYVANASTNNLIVVNTAKLEVVASVDLSPYGTSPRSIGVTNNYDLDDTDETIFVAMFFAQLRPGKDFTHEGQDDQRQGQVVAISAATNSALTTANPVNLAPQANTGFNANGRLAGGPGGETVVTPTNPQAFTTSTGAFPNQLSSVAIQPYGNWAYVVSTGASPNGPVRFNVNNQGLVSVFNINTRAHVASGQTGASVRQTAPLNLNQGINFEPSVPRLFLSNPVAMAWRPDGSDAWVVIQNSDVVVRMTVDGNGVPTIGTPLAAGGTTEFVRVDLHTPGAGRIIGKAPRGIAINNAGTTAYVYNFISRSLTQIDISTPTTPTITGTTRASRVPAAGSNEAFVLQGAELFFSGRGPEERMSNESWGSCITCHPNGRSDNVTWMFAAGPRQTVPLDGMFNKRNPSDQRILNWSAIFDENHDFELNTRGVFGGRGLIDNDRLFFAAGGTAGVSDSALIQQFQQFTGNVTTTNDLRNGLTLPTLTSFTPRRDFAIATLSTDRVFMIGGRSGVGAGALVPTGDSIIEFNPRTNVIRRRSSIGFTPRHSLGAAVVRTSAGPLIYVAGGYTSTSPTATPVSTVEEFNPATNSWRTVASLPTGVAQFGTTVTGGTNSAEPRQLIHVVGGNTGSESAPALANVSGNATVQRFQADPAGTGAWTTFNPTGLTPRRNHGAATAFRGVTSRVFVVGGQNAAGTVLGTVDEYLGQAVTTVATPHTSLPAPRARFGISSSLSTNQVYVIGGVDGAGTAQTTVFEYTIANQGATPGPLGTPSGTWATRGAGLPFGSSNLQVSTPAGVTNFLPARNAGRDRRQDAIAAWIASKVRAGKAPVDANDPAAVRGRELFSEVGLVVPGTSCASCHGGAKWTRSRVDYPAPPSPDDNLGLGDERVIGAELRKTASQASVLHNVGTFTLGGGRQNETRFNGADIAQQIAPLGANGFNIPSLLSVYETAPYYYSGLAMSLEEVLDGTHDGNGGVRHHLVVDPKKRQDLIEFLRSIDETTPIFP